jgi:hypothetical protein
MRGFSPVALLAACCVGGWLMVAPRLLAQAPAGGQAAAGSDSAAIGQSKPAGESPRPSAAPQSNANPFPEDTSTVPVMPSSNAPAFSPGSDSGAGNPGIAFPGEDADPTRSPDDAAAAAGNGQGQTWSSSLSGVDNLLPQQGDGQPGKKKKLLFKEVTHQEGSKEDISVGSYYLDIKDWKGALSRFESALVLDPENPEVYWGLAEADRHLGNLADARANYQKVVEYDPGSHHAKEAGKALEDPAIANGKNAAPSPPDVADTPQ